MRMAAWVQSGEDKTKFKTRQGIKLDSENFEKNPRLQQLSKIMLNIYKVKKNNCV